MQVKQKEGKKTYHQEHSHHSSSLEKKDNKSRLNRLEVE